MRETQKKNDGQRLREGDGPTVVWLCLFTVFLVCSTKMWLQDWGQQLTHSSAPLTGSLSLLLLLVLQISPLAWCPLHRIKCYTQWELNDYALTDEGR